MHYLQFIHKACKVALQLLFAALQNLKNIVPF